MKLGSGYRSAVHDAVINKAVTTEPPMDL